MAVRFRLVFAVLLGVGSVAAADLDLGARVEPAPLAARFSDPDWHIWCGAPIRGDDGKYHLLYSRWPAKVGFAPGWALHSEIAYAVADQPLGPYKFVNVALPARGVNPATGQKFWDGDVTRNPNVLRHPNGKFYLLHGELRRRKRLPDAPQPPAHRCGGRQSPRVHGDVLTNPSWT